MAEFRPTPSMLSSAERCLLQVYYFHILRVIQPPGMARLYGTNLHNVMLEVDQASKINTGQYQKLDHLKEIFDDQLSKDILTVPDNDEPIARLGGPEKARVAFQGFGLGTLDKYNENRDVLSGRSVETPFDVPFADASLHGRIDVDVDDTRHRDLKTKDLSKKGARRPTQEECDDNTQISAYAAAKAKMTGKQEQFTDMVFACTNSTIQTFSTFRSAEDHKQTEEKVYRLHKIVDAGAFYPTGQKSWCCDAKWCGVYPANAPVSCPFGERARVSVTVPK